MKFLSLPMFSTAAVCVFLFEAQLVHSFVGGSKSHRPASSALFDTVGQVDSVRNEELLAQKKKLLSFLGPKTFVDPVLADPVTKEGIRITSTNSASFKITSPTAMYEGSADTFLNLLEPVSDDPEPTTAEPSSLLRSALRQFVPAIPPPLRGTVNSILGDEEDEYIPMRDLFTNPSVSFAYERGWRQGFAGAGFPGPDTEAQMVIDYFAPVVARANPSSVVVDMSCATGLFTRRLAKSGNYGRVLGCDYSESMLLEARRRIKADPELSRESLKTSLDLVRLSVSEIPMKSDSVDCLHAGAAMHCWNDLNAAASEIYRVLKPGGRYFATTFLSTYFSNVAALDTQSGMSASQQAFQYFDSVDTLKNLLVEGGFEESKVSIEVLGTACVVIRAEK